MQIKWDGFPFLMIDVLHEEKKLAFEHTIMCEFLTELYTVCFKMVPVSYSDT